MTEKEDGSLGISRQQIPAYIENARRIGENVIETVRGVVDPQSHVDRIAGTDTDAVLRTSDIIIELAMKCGNPEVARDELIERFGTLRDAIAWYGRRGKICRAEGYFNELKSTYRRLSAVTNDAAENHEQ